MSLHGAVWVRYLRGNGRFLQAEGATVSAPRHRADQDCGRALHRRSGRSHGPPMMGTFGRSHPGDPFQKGDDVTQTLMIRWLCGDPKISREVICYQDATGKHILSSQVCAFRWVKVMDLSLASVISFWLIKLNERLQECHWPKKDVFVEVLACMLLVLFLFLHN